MVLPSAEIAMAPTPALLVGSLARVFQVLPPFFEMEARMMRLLRDLRRCGADDEIWFIPGKRQMFRVAITLAVESSFSR